MNPFTKDERDALRLIYKCLELVKAPYIIKEGDVIIRVRDEFYRDEGFAALSHIHTHINNAANDRVLLASYRTAGN